jgi:hypothetical protein
MRKGELLVHRIATIALSLCLLLGLTGTHHLRAQEETKKEKDESPKPDASKPEAPKEETPKPDASAATETAPPPIPPEVELKLEAARRAVAEAIVAAQDAGLVKTTIDPPPILDILLTGRANDEATLKAHTGVSPEVFGAWFTGYGTVKDITPQKDVRITQPDRGLKELYNQRANLLNRHIEAVRKAQEVAKKDEAPKTDVKPEPKKDEPKAEDAKKDNSEANSPKDDAKKDDTKSDASKNESPK